MKTRFVLSGGRTIEAVRDGSHVLVILKKGTKEKKQKFPAKVNTVVEFFEEDGSVRITLRPPRGKTKMELMNFNLL
ncbi:MAG: hypothetical protein AB1333_03900 [Patescibacteria group bacterium]